VGRAINRAWDIQENRRFHVRKLRDMGMALGTGVLFLLSLGATSTLSILHGLDLPFVNVAAEAGTRVLGFAFSLGIFLGLYKVVPNTKTYWRYVWPGALLGAAMFEVAKSLFVLYLGRFASYESVYGSVASVIILLVWIFVSAFILLVGAEFSAEYGRMRRGVQRGTLIAEQMKGVERSDAGTKQDVQETGGQ
jgi:membrane protein